MTLTEFNDKYYFHDSVIDKLEYQSGTLTIYCQFCDFMQADYKDTDYSNSDIIITFHNAKYTLTSYFQIVDAEIINQIVIGNKMKLFLENYSNQCGELEITAEYIEVKKLRSYNL